ncbi:MAG: TlpA family protein disulfide reductase [Pseudomonadota bacterium]
MSRTLHPVIALVLVLLAYASPASAGSLDLAQYRGKVVYVDFWASWCVPCRKSFPWLNGMARKYPDDLVVVGVNVDRERSAAMKFLERHPASFPLVFDPDGKLADEYRLQGMPSSVLIGRDGQIAERHVGFREERLADYEATVRKLIGK